jgi:LacI family gluconate utilization system Gnt-I transcriptional repressor
MSIRFLLPVSIRKLTDGMDPTPKTRRKPPTLRDVANAANLATITVSRALRGSPLVTAETRARIDEIAKLLGYLPNQVASSLKSRRTGLIAVIVPTVSGSVFAETIDSLSATLHQTGYQFMIGESSYDMAREHEVVRALMVRRPDGAIIVGVNHSAATRELLSSLNVPVVEIWDMVDDAIDSVVGFSNRDAARDFTTRLIARGYRRFALASGPMDSSNRAARRAEGHRAALAEKRLPIGPTAVVPHFLGILESGAELEPFIL